MLTSQDWSLRRLSHKLRVNRLRFRQIRLTCCRSVRTGNFQMPFDMQVFHMFMLTVSWWMLLATLVLTFAEHGIIVISP